MVPEVHGSGRSRGARWGRAEMYEVWACVEDRMAKSKIDVMYNSNSSVGGRRMKTIFSILAVCMLFVLLLQVGPSLAQGPDHRPEPWELTATAEAGGSAPHQPVRPTRVQPTATVQPYPIETPDPYPMPEQSGGFVEWLRRLFEGEWRVE